MFSKYSIQVSTALQPFSSILENISIIFRNLIRVSSMNTKVLIYIILSKKIDRNSRYIEYTRLFRILENYGMILHSDKTISFKNYTIINLKRKFPFPLFRNQ